MTGSIGQRLQALGITLPAPPRPLGSYVEAVRVGNLLFVSGTLPLDSGVPRFLGRLGAEVSIADGRRATRLASLNALALAQAHLGSLDKVLRVARLTVSLATTPEFRDHPEVADGASELLADVFGAEQAATRMVAGVVSLPKGVCAVVEIILEHRTV